MTSGTPVLPLTALYSRWLTTLRMGENASKQPFPTAPTVGELGRPLAGGSERELDHHRSRQASAGLRRWLTNIKGVPLSHSERTDDDPSHPRVETKHHSEHRLEVASDGPLANFSTVLGPFFDRFAEVEPNPGGCAVGCDGMHRRKHFFRRRGRAINPRKRTP